MDQSHLIAQQVKSTLPANLPQLDPAALSRLKEQALTAARQLQQQAVHTATTSAQHANAVAHDVAASRSAKEARTKLWVVLRQIDSSAWFAKVARAMVCIYFLNLCYEDVEAWRQNNTPEMRMQWAQFNAAIMARKPHFPWLEVLVLAPCAVLAASGVKPMWTASPLVIDMVYDSWNLILTQLLFFLLYGQQPNELAVKKLAMFGCAALVFAHAAKNRIPANSYAGLLLHGSDGKQKVGARKSAVLLLSRLLMGSLFVFVGVTQMQRVIARDWVLHVQHDLRVPVEVRRDGHDNNWLLVEFALSIPFAIGLKTEAVSRLLALTLLAEALTCWNFLLPWPNWQYKSHVRSHFFTNVGVSGGLCLLQTFGAGIYSVDAILKAKKKL